MASIYKKQNSPFWFIQFVDTDGTRRNKSTGLRADDPGETIKARAMRAQLEAQELNRNAGEIKGGGWDVWVPQYFKRHCERRCYLHMNRAGGRVSRGEPAGTQCRGFTRSGIRHWGGFEDNGSCVAAGFASFMPAVRRWRAGARPLGRSMSDGGRARRLTFAKRKP